MADTTRVTGQYEQWRKKHFRIVNAAVQLIKGKKKGTWKQVVECLEESHPSIFCREGCPRLNPYKVSKWYVKNTTQPTPETVKAVGDKLQDCDVDAPDLLLDVELLKAAFLSVTARAAAEAEDGEPAASSSNPEFVTANPSAAAAAMYNTGFLAAVAAMAAPRSSNTGFVTATQSVSVSPWPAQVLMHPWRQRQLPLATVRPSASRLAQAG